MSARKQTCLLPSGFSFNDDERTSIDLCACDWARPKWSFVFAPIEKLIRRSDQYTAVVKTDGTKLTNDDIKIRMLLYCKMLEPSERNFKMEKAHDVIMQTHNINISQRKSEDFDIEWVGQTVAITFAVRRLCNVEDNDPWNLWGLLNEEALEEASIECQGNRVMQETMPAIYWRILIPMERGEHCPEMASYHWAPGNKLSPVNVDTSVNFLRYPGSKIKVKLQKHLSREPLQFITMQTSLIIVRYDRNVVIPIEYDE
jgi:hypothetical protein